MKDSKKAKLNREIEEIKRLKDLQNILKAGDLENALLSNSTQDVEPINENIIDTVLQRAEAQKISGEKNLEVIERLTTSGGATITKEKKVKVIKGKGGIKVKRSYHLVKKLKKKQRR